VTDEYNVFLALKEDGYRLGDLAVLRYDKTNKAQFPEGYLGYIHKLCQESKITDSLFGGNPASDFDSIVSYLASRPVIVMGRWIPLTEEDGFTYQILPSDPTERFVEYGFAFPVITCGRPDTEKSMFAGFCFFRLAWGTEDERVLAMLGLAYLFQEFSLVAIHGTRYSENLLPAKFMAQFGMKQVGEVPCYQLKGTKLVPGIVSSLLREDFERFVEDWLVAALHAEVAPVIGTPEHPAVEESRETIDAQIERLAARQIPVVFFPLNSTYIPAVPDGCGMQFVSSGNPGAGIYFFDPEKLSAEEIVEAGINGTHGELLGHAQNKMEIARTEPTVVIQAIGPFGVVLQDSVVSKTAEAIAVQVEIFKRKYPDCECVVKEPMEVIRARSESPVAAVEPEEPDYDAQLPLSWL